MLNLVVGLVLVLLVLVVYLSVKYRSVRKRLQNAEQRLEKSQQQIDGLYRENLILKHLGKEYTVSSDYEVKLLKIPPILDFIRKKYYPVIRVEGTIDSWKIVLLGADIYVEDKIGNDNDGALVVERCIARISAEEFDDFLRQFQSGFAD